LIFLDDFIQDDLLLKGAHEPRPGFHCKRLGHFFEKYFLDFVFYNYGKTNQALLKAFKEKDNLIHSVPPEILPR
jgi:hypothetical protein